MFSNAPQTITLSIGTASQIPMANSMPSANVTYTPANSVTVATAGNYEISFQVNGTAALAASVTVAVRNNGTNIPSLTMKMCIRDRNMEIPINGLMNDRYAARTSEDEIGRAHV